MGGSSCSLTVGGGGGKIYKEIFHCLGGRAAAPRWFVLFSKGFILQSKAYWNGLSFSISPVHKETRHKDDAFFQGGLATPALPLDPPLPIYLHLQLSSLLYFFFSYSFFFSYLPSSLPLLCSYFPLLFSLSSSFFSFTLSLSTSFSKSPLSLPSS